MKRKTCDEKEVDNPSKSVLHQNLFPSDVPQRFGWHINWFFKIQFCFFSWLHSMWAGSKRWISSLAPVKGMKDLIGRDARKYNQVVNIHKGYH